MTRRRGAWAWDFSPRNVAASSGCLTIATFHASNRYLVLCCYSAIWDRGSSLTLDGSAREPYIIRCWQSDRHGWLQRTRKTILTPRHADQWNLLIIIYCIVPKLTLDIGELTFRNFSSRLRRTSAKPVWMLCLQMYEMWRWTFQRSKPKEKWSNVLITASRMVEYKLIFV